MTIKLNDAQLVMLSKAAHRDDRCLTPPAGLRGATLAAVGAKLLGTGLVKQTKLRGSTPIWRRDAATGAAIALTLTPAGLKAIAVDEGEDVAVVAPEAIVPAAAVTSTESPRMRTKARPSLKRKIDRKEGASSGADSIAKPTRATASSDSVSEASGSANPDRSPRAGSKLASVIELLARPGGATISELVATTGWLSHTTRAALTGLRKRGYAVDLDRSGRERGSVYRIEIGRDAKTSSVAASMVSPSL